jgi:hypothetical protein
MSQQETDKEANMVREWLMDEGIYKDKIVDDTARYHFVAEFPQGSGQMYDVIFPKIRPDLIVIVSGVQLSSQHLSGLTALPKPRLDEFLWELKFQFITMKTDFIFNPPTPDSVPRIIQFQKPLYYDGLNKNLFMEGLKSVHFSRLFIIWKMAQMFGVETPKSTQPMYG